MWREYLTPIGETIERARFFERMLAVLDPAEIEAVTGRLRHLDVPVLLVWGTAEEALGVEWAPRPAAAPTPRPPRYFDLK